jgi:hypothetical protein
MAEENVQKDTMKKKTLEAKVRQKILRKISLIKLQKQMIKP